MMLQPDNGELGIEKWLKQPEDVFYAGVLYHKLKGNYKYQSMWGVLRFESAMGPKRLELYEPDSKEKYFVINANIYPLTTIPFTQILGLHPDYTMRPGVFPFNVLTTAKKFYLGAKTKEDQQEWLAKINGLLLGIPLPNRTCEYLVMVFPTKNSEEMNMKGQYILKVTEHNVHLIPRDTSLHMAFKIPLSSIVKANHTVFYNSAIQFSPLSDRKSTIKALGLTVEMDCSLEKRGYVFAATSAAEIASIINERRTRLCKPRPNTIPVRSSPLPSDSSNTDEEPLTHMEILQLMESIKQDATKSSPGCGDTSPIQTSLTPVNGLASFSRCGNTMYVDHFAAAKVSHQNSTMSNQCSVPLLDITSCVTKNSKTAGKKPEKARRKSQSSSQIDHTSRQDIRKYSLPKVLTSCKFHPKKIIQRFCLTGNPRRPSIGSGNSLANVSCPMNYYAGREQFVVESQAPSQPERALLYDQSSESVVTGDDDDRLSMTSSASLHGTINKSSLNRTLTSPIPTCTYTNFRCLVCSKIHQQDENGPCFSEEPKKAKWEHLDSLASSNHFQRSRSLADLVEPIPHQHSASAEMDSSNPLKFARSDSYGALSIGNHKRRPISNLATINRSKLVSSTATGSHVSPQTSIYRSIPNDSPYEQVPKVKLEDAMATNSVVHTVHNSDITPLTSSWLHGNGLHTVTLGTGKEKDQDTYESIKNSGPYEQVPHMAFYDATKYPASVQAPLSLPQRRKTERLVHRHTPTTGNYESIQNDSSLILATISKRYGSLGDLLDSKRYDSLDLLDSKRYDSLDLLDTCSTDETEINYRNITNKKTDSLPRKQEIAQLMPGNHHVVNVELSEEQTSPPPLPYAIVWIER